MTTGAAVISPEDVQAAAASEQVFYSLASQRAAT